MRKNILRIVVALCLLALPLAASTPGTHIACNSGVSPCTISNSALDVLSVNGLRTSCNLEAVGAVDLYCRRTTAALGAASASTFDFLIGGSSALKQGGTYTCGPTAGNDIQAVWQGPINCIASASSAVVDLAVTETQ
jgi:hypothetical protein